MTTLLIPTDLRKMQDLGQLLAPTNDETPDWRTYGNCARPGMPDMQPDEATPEWVAALQQVCVGCPVRLQCGQLAKLQTGAYGIHDGHWWGEGPTRPKRESAGD